MEKPQKTANKKLCSTCGEMLPFSAFNRDRGLSVAIFKKQEVNIKDGQLHTTYSANIQRSWQKPEDKGTETGNAKA